MLKNELLRIHGTSMPAQSGIARQLQAGGFDPQRTQDLINGITALTRGMTGLEAVQQAQAEYTFENTRALIQSTAAKGGDSIGAIAKGASGLLSGGLGLSPIFTSLIHLFTGGSHPAALPALQPFQLPPAISVEAGLSSQNASNSASKQSTSTPAVTVNVNAMDSRSFLDHSGEIARAVREALLTSHSLADTIAEL